MAKKKKSKKEKIDLAQKIAVVASFKIGDIENNQLPEKLAGSKVSSMNQVI